MNKTLEKFATQLDSALLADLRGLAKAEGRQIQSLVEEAVSKLIAERRDQQPRKEVMDAYERARTRYASVFKKLAE
ncbi:MULTISPECIES: hypothetical protein [Hyphobacterium]|uniref:Ribbon-helix-helix protein CopG domain-containing protein n=1 Tax=Hyphobacterium vulgare TaxID=1736751 RepID=A0ABV6ZUK3_9PROT